MEIIYIGIEETKEQDITITLNKATRLNKNEKNRKNSGYAAPSKIYHELGLHTFFLNKFRHSKVSEYTINNIAKLLVFSRLLFPASKKSTYENRDMFFENTNYSLEEVYNSFKHQSSE